jgi:hypothetical protein
VLRGGPSCRPNTSLDRREGDIGERARRPLTPRPGPASRLERDREEPLERGIKRAGGPRRVNRNPKLVEDLILADDHRIASDSDRHRVMNGVLAGQGPTTHREGRSEPLGVVRAREVALYPMAGLEQERLAGRLRANRRCEPLAVGGRDVTGMGHERDDGDDHFLRHAWRSSFVDAATGRL